ncbi:MAG: class II glutamine amidotransferase [Polyangiales bacterium]
MPNVFAMSFEGELAPSFDLRCLREGRKPPDGWGIGYYPGGEPSASVLKEPAPSHGSIRSELIKAWEHLASSLFVVHIRTATWGHISGANTQPFERSWGGRDWLFAHSGSLSHRLEPAPMSHHGEPARAPSPFEPVGSTDTELIFCDLLNRMARRGWHSLREVDHETLHRWFDAINDHGTLTTILTDGHDMAVYADRHGDGGVYLWQLRPPYGELQFGDADLAIDLTKRGIKSRKGVLVSSNPLESTTDTPADWQRLSPGHMVMIRQGAIRAEIAPPPRGTGATISVPPVASSAGTRLPAKAETRTFEIKHRTSYRYDKAIERSSHHFRLTPIHDHLQRVIHNQIDISVDGQSRSYEDVFGNRVMRVLLETPFTELTIEARSRVECLDVDPMKSSPLRVRSTIPLVWMPWQRQVLQPFLLPQELPESELSELVEYAMSFVERNDYDLLDTLLDINSSIFNEYAYRQGTTTNATTPFDVYANRRGVCQDFANLFICLARLLGVPARYVCGYIYTGPKNPNQRQSEASHAWVQMYLPEMGWRGFDPTNGVLTQTDHVRVAVGRNYVDATPTSGTIFVGGGGTETLEVEVTVEPSDEK